MRFISSSLYFVLVFDESTLRYDLVRIDLFILYKRQSHQKSKKAKKQRTKHKAQRTKHKEQPTKSNQQKATNKKTKFRIFN